MVVCLKLDVLVFVAISIYLENHKETGKIKKKRSGFSSRLPFFKRYSLAYSQVMVICLIGNIIPISQYFILYT